MATIFGFLLHNELHKISQHIINMTMMFLYSPEIVIKSSRNNGIKQNFREKFTLATHFARLQFLVDTVERKLSRSKSKSTCKQAKCYEFVV